MGQRKIVRVSCPDCGFIRERKAGWKSLFCRSCAHKKEGTDHKRYGREYMRRLRARWKEAGKHPEIKQRNTEYRLRRYERLAGRPCGEICECCGLYCSKAYVSGYGNSTRLVFDHDHATGKFRGWICTACNKILGQADDNPENLRRCIQYLEKHRG